MDNFDIDENVSVFETTIRFLGGLLSAHMFLIDNSTILQQYNQQQVQQPVQYQQQYNILLNAGKRVSSAEELNQIISSNPAYVKFFNQYWKEKSI